MLSEEIQERRVLPEGRVAVGRIVVGRLIVAEEDDDALSDQTFQFGTSPNVSFLAEHVSVVFKSFSLTCADVFMQCGADSPVAGVEFLHHTLNLFAKPSLVEVETEDVLARIQLFQT